MSDELAKYTAPDVDGVRVADAEHAELIVTELRDALVDLAAQYVDQVIHAEALALGFIWSLKHNPASDRLCCAALRNDVSGVPFRSECGLFKNN